MKAASFISGRLRFEGKMAMVSIAISFLVMILAVSISSGFRRELRRGISGISGDVQIVPADLDFTGEESPLPRHPSYEGLVDSLAEVETIVPTVYRAGIIRSGENIHGVLFKGTPDGPDSLGARVPSRLADILGISVGDELPAYFVGERVKVRKFTVREIYPSILSGDDNLVVFTGLSDMQRLNGWSEEEVSALEVILSEGNSSPTAINAATQDIGFGIMFRTPEDESIPVARSSVNRYPQIFSWLDLIDFNVMIILILMTIVAGFNMISGLLILLFRNISTIGTLKSLGMTDRNISEVFLRASAVVVLKGMLIGNAVALLFCFIQGKTHFIPLNPENYFLSYVPVSVNVPWIIAADVISFIVIMLLLLIPCLFVSRVDPAKTVRAQ
ncbi:MAG: ABC transporter permease [Bacteroidales bacterium]|nr:ABC transporter permease [Bacteroidales bacterium]